MEKREYEEELDRLRNEIRKIEEQEQECIALKRKVEMEEELLEIDIKNSVTFNTELEEDWRSRNMLKQQEYLFLDTDMYLNKINSERNGILRDGLNDFDQYIKKLSWEEENCREQISRLSREYNETKEENENGTSY
ncbi:hypothetical protein M2145_002525 [Lachnospiraceae bacterium PF1-21]